MEPSALGPVIVTRDLSVVEELQRLCAGAALMPSVIDQPELVRRAWKTAPCLLIGEDCVAEVAAMQLARRDGVVLVARAPESAAIWQHGVSVRADNVAVLPDAERWLVDWLAETRDRDAGRATAVGVIGARGGAGASTVAASLALAAANRNYDTVLVDADPLGGGIELIMGCEDIAGLRWGDVSATEGKVSGAALRAALPVRDGVAVLSAGGFGLPRLHQVRGMLEAARPGSDLLVVDLARRIDDQMIDLVSCLDVLVVVTTPEIRSVAGARLVIESLQTYCADLRLTIRNTRFASLTAEDVVESLGIPLIGAVSTRRSVQRSIDEGLGPTLLARERRVMQRLLDSLPRAPRPVGIS